MNTMTIATELKTRMSRSESVVKKWRCTVGKITEATAVMAMPNIINQEDGINCVKGDSSDY